MFDYNVKLAIKDLFLFQYILADAINSKEVFKRLCDIFCVDQDERDVVIELIEDRKINEIHTLNDYYREIRLKQYYESFCGGYIADDDRIEELIAVKGSVFEKAQKDKLLSAYEKSCGRAYDELLRLASAGTVSAKRIVGIMQTEGIYVTQDIAVGLQNLQDAADWLDIRALVTYLYYSETDRKEYLDKLYTVTQTNDYAVLVEQLQIQYGIENCEVSKAAKMLEKAFIVDNAKRETCSSQLLRIIRSKVLSEKDKRTVLLNGNEGLIPAVCGLPLKLEMKKIEMIEGTHPVLNRNDEKSLVVRAFEHNDLRNRDFFRCLCISSNSEYIREAYSDTICDLFRPNNVEQIDVAALLPADFESTENNVFLRSCREKQNNVFIIKLSGKIDERLVQIIKTFATSNGRKTFAVSRLGVSIDLSAVLPIFICDRKNSQLLNGNVNVVKVAEISESEKSLVLSDILRKKQVAFSASIISIEDAAKDILLNMPIDEVGNILDRAILAEHIDNGPIYLTAETVRECVGDKMVPNTYGFGGAHATK